VYEQQIAYQASGIAGAIEHNDFNTASTLLFQDTQHMGGRYAEALINETNGITQRDAANNNYIYDQVQSTGQINQYGLPIVSFTNEQNPGQADGSVALDTRPLPPPSPVYEAPPSYGYAAPPPEYGYAPPPPPVPYRDGCGASEVGGAAIGALAGAMAHSGLGEVLGAVGGAAIGNSLCNENR